MGDKVLILTLALRAELKLNVRMEPCPCAELFRDDGHAREGSQGTAGQDIDQSESPMEVTDGHPNQEDMHAQGLCMGADLVRSYMV